MLFLYRFLSGALLVEFSGIYPEKIFNLCARNRINIWGMQHKEQKLCCNITVKDFLKLPKILRKSGIRVHILKKSGFPFFIRKYNKRFGVFAGIVLFFLFLQIMSGYIWIIEVEGNKNVDAQNIITACESLGIKQGVKKSKINAKADAQDLLLKTEELAWASLNIEGCKLTVNVTEITQKKEDNTVATNLKASADGVITHIDVTSGNCVVKVGDVVKKGDVLVSGIIENEWGTRFVHSIGKIMAKTETQITIKEKFIQQSNVETGKVKSRKVIDFFGIKIPLYLGSIRGNYKTQKSVWQMQFLGQKLPVKIHTKRYIFQAKHTVTYDYEKAVQKLEDTLKNEYGDKVKSKEYKELKDGVQLKAIIIDKQNIAVSEKLLVAN